MKEFFINIALWLFLIPLLFAMAICKLAGLSVFLIFLILKLTGQIAWAWIIVCIPAIAWVVTVAIARFVKALVEAIRENI